MSLILASASPRRAELLASAGFTFTVEAAAIDETPLGGEAPEPYVLRVAREKARAVLSRCRTSGDLVLVLGADTVVVAGGEVLGKPVGPEDSARMLERLSGAVHEVLTGVVLLGGERELAEVVRTRVRFLPLSACDIDWYVNSGEPEGKAGAYAIQGRAARFIDWIEGSWSNVVGLPVATVHRLVQSAGVAEPRNTREEQGKTRKNTEGSGLS